MQFLLSFFFFVELLNIPYAKGLKLTDDVEAVVPEVVFMSVLTLAKFIKHHGDLPTQVNETLKLGQKVRTSEC